MAFWLEKDAWFYLSRSGSFSPRSFLALNLGISQSEVEYHVGSPIDLSGYVYHLRL